MKRPCVLLKTYLRLI